MTKDLTEHLLDLIPTNISDRGKITLDARLAPIRDILNRQRFPATPLTDWQIEQLLNLFSSMDSDKDPDAARMGEREGRVASPLVSQLAGGFNHGIGRSGRILAPQPKAAGASLMQKLTNNIVLDAIKQLGLHNVRAAMILPLGTGMSIALTLSMLRREYNIQNVLYPRIDHTSPKRGIDLVGVTMVSVATELKGDGVQVDMNDFEKKLGDTKSSCVLGTSTFFAPRESDPIKPMAKMCLEHDVPFIVNNAYGIQSESVMASISSAIDAGRVDAVIQSTDKNFLTPVGGSIVVSPNESTINEIAESYAGRATAAPIVQTLSSLLAIGYERYIELRKIQLENRRMLESLLADEAERLNQRVLDIDNPVSCALTLDGFDVREIGARLYQHRVTGPRAVQKNSYGSCIEGYPHDYLVMNAAIGSQKKDITIAVDRLISELKKI
ncbi:MAG: O-phosphoseryl-tRNA(Sec) selenium transferase [Candidatus Lokiarchaeota archaeon]|nr:O-phosphoseryl-tRNA(Sec) selenium transferase [Candidatus Lokiarchaeota archaeon]